MNPVARKSVSPCRLKCRPRHLTDEGRRICNRDCRRCARCRLYTFIIGAEWPWKLCGTCYHKLKGSRRSPGLRWRVGS